MEQSIERIKSQKIEGFPSSAYDTAIAIMNSQQLCKEFNQSWMGEKIMGPLPSSLLT